MALVNEGNKVVDPVSGTTVFDWGKPAPNGTALPQPEVVKVAPNKK